MAIRLLMPAHISCLVHVCFSDAREAGEKPRRSSDLCLSALYVPVVALLLHNYRRRISAPTVVGVVGMVNKNMEANLIISSGEVCSSHRNLREYRLPPVGSAPQNPIFTWGVSRASNVFLKRTWYNRVTLTGIQ